MTEPKLTVWGRADSSNVQAVMWCLAELGLTATRHDVGHRFGGTDTAEFLAMNPNGTVPVLQDGDASPIWETGAILRYLAARYAPPAFWPADPTARAEVDKWAEWAKVSVAVAFSVPVFWAVVRTAEADRDGPALARALALLDSRLAIAEARLAAQPWLAGAEFTLADIQFGHFLYRYFDIDIPRPERPALGAYCDRLTARPAYREHVMISYEALRVP